MFLFHLLWILRKWKFVYVRKLIKYIRPLSPPDQFLGLKEAVFEGAWVSGRGGRGIINNFKHIHIHVLDTETKKVEYKYEINILN